MQREALVHGDNAVFAAYLEPKAVATLKPRRLILAPGTNSNATTPFRADQLLEEILSVMFCP